MQTLVPALPEVFNPSLGKGELGSRGGRLNRVNQEFRSPLLASLLLL